MSSSKNIELLCPARNFETGLAAINHGADAVYIGYKNFGARKIAGNSLQDIEKLIKHAHLYHAKVYITLNTILYDNELHEVQTLARSLYNMGADALIIQDMGILEMDLPPIPLHASTQTNNVDIQKIKFLQDVGFQRVILARELSLSEIQAIKNNTSIELEVFIHGALCVSYSGQCYLSQALSGRSANRGECAQPCRLPYNLLDQEGKVLARNKHLLSLKDLNQTNNIQQIIDSGVTSLKVEGRLKDIAYVKNITAHYRQIIDSLIEKDKSLKRASSGKTTFSFSPDPQRTFNRGNTSFFIDGRQSNLASFNTPKSLGKLLGSVYETNTNSFKISTSEQIRNNDGLCFLNNKGELTGFKVNGVQGDGVFPNQPIVVQKNALIYRNYDHSFNQELSQKITSSRLIDCIIEVFIETNTITLQLTDEDHISTSLYADNNFEMAQNKNLAHDTLSSQLKKMGNTPFVVNDVKILNATQYFPFIALGLINGLRRDLVEKHTKLRYEKHEIRSCKIVPNSILYPNVSLDQRANISNTLAQKFYLRHGVKEFVIAFELQNNFIVNDLMETKYCILYELDMCKGSRAQNFKNPLFLEHNNNKLSINFSCNECKMRVKIQEK